VYDGRHASPLAVTDNIARLDNTLIPIERDAFVDCDGKLRGEFNKRQLKPYRTESDPETH